MLTPIPLHQILRDDKVRLQMSDEYLAVRLGITVKKLRRCMFGTSRLSKKSLKILAEVTGRRPDELHKADLYQLDMVKAAREQKRVQQREKERQQMKKQRKQTRKLVLTASKVTRSIVERPRILPLRPVRVDPVYEHGGGI